MIKTVTSILLPVLESLEIRKNRLEPEEAGEKKRISIVTGIHGDELEGQYVCYEVGRRIMEHPESLHGIVDLYPAANPLGIDSVTRGIPGFDLDMNRLFPGTKEGAMTEFMVSEIFQDLLGSDLCLDIHASNIYLTEVPQIRINEQFQEQLVPYAKKANIDFIWVHGANTVLEATLAHSLNSRNVPTLVVEMGVGMRITKSYGDQLVEGIFCLMKELGIWSGETIKPKKAIISDKPEEVVYLNAPVSGIFLKENEHGRRVKKGERIGKILDPLSCTVLSEIVAPESGFLFTIREYPVVAEGSLMGRILVEKEHEGREK